MAGTPRSSGDVQTGEVNVNRGGGRLVTLFSGALAPGVAGGGVVAGTTGHVYAYSGGGRLGTVVIHQAISGVQAQFYDAALIARSGIGTVPESGYKILAVTPANTFNGTGGQLLGGPMPLVFDTPFQSGLCVNYPSGCPGLSFSFSPESSVLDDGSVTGA